MTKRILALSLALVMALLCLTACSHGELDKGAYIRMYLSEPVYDLDPINAFDNEASLQVVSLLFEGLFTADRNGKPQKALVKDYKYTEDKANDSYVLTLNLKESHWSDGVAVSANDVQYSFRRLFYLSHPATVLLYDIKNARDIVKGDDSIDHLGVTVKNNLTVEIEFEQAVNVDDFLVTLTSPALYPLREDIVATYADWAQNRTNFVCSGPFRICTMDFNEPDGFTLERNAYYYRDRAKDDIDEYVTPFRLVIDYKTKAADQFKRFDSEEEGALYYIGHIPLSVRKDDAYAELLKRVSVSDAPSTHVYYLNQNALVDGDAIFADAAVRKALSLAIDRNAIVEALVYAKAADGLVPSTLLNRPDKKTAFRKEAESYIAASANVSEAKQLLSKAGVNAGSYSFSITVAAYDEEHMATAALVKAAWQALGFHVSIEALDATAAEGGEELTYREALSTGNFEVIALDLVATAPDAFSYLAPFAAAFSGNTVDFDSDEVVPHVTGYNSAAYNEKIEAAFAADNKTAATLLHEAEAILMEDMPVIPIVYNQNATLCSKKLKNVKGNFFCAASFTSAKLKNYWDIALRDKFITEEELAAQQEN